MKTLLRLMISVAAVCAVELSLVSVRAESYMNDRALIGKNVDHVYGQFLDDAAKRGADVAAIRSLLIRRETVAADRYDGARAGGITAADQAAMQPVFADLRASHEQIDREFERSFGEAEWMALRQYRLREPERETLTVLSKDFIAAGVPLSEEQVRALVEDLYSSRESSGVRKFQPVHLKNPVDDRLHLTILRQLPLSFLPKARARLSTQQCDVLSRIYRERGITQ